MCRRSIKKDSQGRSAATPRERHLQCTGLRHSELVAIVMVTIAGRGVE